MAERVEVIIAVHDLRRRVDRAVASILRQGDGVSALVVCHNLDADAVRDSLGDLGRQDRVSFLAHHDALASPSGPFNAGIRRSSAQWVSIMGSDDELADGAVAAWLAAAEPDTDAVIPRLVRGEARNLVRSPPARPLRRGRGVDAVKDRLSYRSAPLGLVRRASVAHLQLELEEGARNGGDLPFATDLWFGGRIVSALDGPPYIEHADAPVRVTHVAKPVAEELAPVERLVASPSLIGRPRAEREAIAVKLFRRNVKGAVLKRDGGHGLTAPDLVALARVCSDLVACAPRLPRILSRADARLLALLRAQEDPAGALGTAGASSAPADVAAADVAADVAVAFHATEHLRSAGVLLAADPRMTWHREAPLRYMTASALMR